MLGTFLLMTLLQGYLSYKKTYYLQQALNFLAENGRFASYFLTENMQLAGSNQCQTNLPKVNIIKGYTGNTLPEYLKNNRIVKDSDVIEIYRCDKMSDQEQLQYIKADFFVAQTLYKDNNGLPIYGLYEKKTSLNNLTHTQELVTGIKDMRAQYGLSNQNQGINAYLNSSQISNSDWQKVSSIKIALLLYTLDNVTDQMQSYQFQHQKYPGDRRLHKEWNLYVALRNFHHEY